MGSLSYVKQSPTLPFSVPLFLQTDSATCNSISAWFHVHVCASKARREFFRFPKGTILLLLLLLCREVAVSFLN